MMAEFLQLFAKDFRGELGKTGMVAI